jgi:hypothetical protein
MNCIKHVTAAAAGTCAACAEPFCSPCLVTVKGAKYCSECKNTAIKGDAVGSAQGPVGVCQEANDALKYALIGIVCFGIILEPIAISKALKAKKMIAENPRLEGSGKATAALVIACAALCLWVLGMIARVTAAGRGASELP